MRAIVFLVKLFFVLVSFGCTASEPGGRDLDLNAEIKDGVVTLYLSNISDHKVLIAPDFAYGGVGGGNIIGFISTSLGQVAAPCVKLDTLSAFGAPIELSSNSKKAWMVSIKEIARWHCLEPGRFSIVFAYRSISGDLITARPMTFQITTDELTKKGVRDN